MTSARQGKRNRAPKRGRKGLGPDRILETAARIADREGIESLSMRRLARTLGVEAMSLYKHVADKDAILDGLADLVVREIGMPLEGADWKTTLRHHAVTTRSVCLRHRWAAGLMEARGAGTPLRLRYAEALLRLLREAGFTVPMAYRAFLLVDSYLYGFLMQEATWPSDEGEMAQRAALMASGSSPSETPTLVEAMNYIMTADSPRKIYQSEFEHGLAMILEGLERAQPPPAREARSGPRMRSRPRV